MRDQDKHCIEFVEDLKKVAALLSEASIANNWIPPNGFLFLAVRAISGDTAKDRLSGCVDFGKNTEGTATDIAVNFRDWGKCFDAEPSDYSLGLLNDVLGALDRLLLQYNVDYQPISAFWKKLRATTPAIVAADPDEPALS